MNHLKSAVCTFLALSISLGPGLSLGQAPNAPLLTNAAQVRALTPEEAGRRRPVRLQGVVTYFRDAAQRDLVVQDPTAGIFLELGDWKGPVLDLKPGDLIELEGVTRAGTFSPVVIPERIEPRGKGALPAPRKVSFEDLASGREDSQFIELGGIVRSASREMALPPPRLILQVAAPGGKIPVWVLHHDGADAGRLIDAQVQVQGVCLHFTNVRGQAWDRRLVVYGMDGIRVDRQAPADPFTLPLYTIDHLLKFSPEGSSPHRVRVQGTLTWGQPGASLFIQDGRRGLQVLSSQGGELRPGDRIEAVGFPSMGEYYARLEDAAFRTVGSGDEPSPAEVSVEEARRGDYDGVLVQVAATFIDASRSGGTGTATLERGGFRFGADLPAGQPDDPFAAIRPGSEVLVTGICEAVAGPSGRSPFGLPSENFRLRLRAPSDVRVLRPGPWWTVGRMAIALGGSALLLASLAAWGLTLRRRNRQLREQIAARRRAEEELQRAHDDLERRVEERSTQLAEEIRARHQAAIEFDAVLRERNRLAADLHDTMEQSLTGVSLQLEAGRATLAVEPEKSSKHLALAKDLLDASRDEVRRAVWDLRSQALEKHELPDALLLVARRAEEGGRARIDLRVAGSPRKLPEAVAHGLLRICQEAIANSLKHGSPDTIRVSLVFEDAAVSLSIEDDGKGFTVGDAPGPETGHFGLQGIRERAKRIGGAMAIESEPGRGTLVRIAVPSGSAGQGDAREGADR